MTDRESLKSKVYQAIGSASMCWDDVAKAGVFHSDEAKKIGDNLWEKIESKIKSLEDEVESLKEENANLGATNETAALTGWICPRCDNSNHPFVTVCSCGEEKK